MISDRREKILARILSRVIMKGYCGMGCWEWQGPTSGNGRGGGYPRMSLNGQTVAVHIVLFTHFFGYVPGKKQLDHTCTNRKCVSPFHLEMVSASENCKRRSRGAQK